MVKHDPTREEYRTITGAGKTVVDFWASWCGPCRSQMPILEQLEATGAVDLIKIDVDNDREFSAEFGVTSIPTLILYEDGKIIKKFVGLTPLAELKAAFGL